MPTKRLPTAPQKPFRPVAQPIRILLAEDEPDMRLLVASVLRTHHYSVEDFVDGESLWAALSTALRTNHGGEPDLIISDLVMPRCTGLELLLRVREANCSAPLILMSAFASTELQHNALKLGASHFFNKPFDLDALLAKVNELTGKGQD